jgi:glutamate formiminotransferase/formiminotetrahydrofolate cyclodeaminase
MQIVECVPNFSEGRDRGVIDAIAGSIARVAGVRLLDVDPGEATNRTVMTFVGPPAAVSEAAFAAIEAAARLIDMRSHTGAHARQGATDVCPFVPVAEVGMDECVALARELGARVGGELGIPVYLYEQAATRPERRSLQVVRAGEYEGLAEKLATPEGAPDFGPAAFNARSGATAVGARKFLIAYNINLNTRDVRIARAIAWRIRDSEGPIRGPDRTLVRDEAGTLVKAPGRFEHCKATGWTIEEYGCAQVTMNLTDWEVTPIHAVFDACCELAEEQGARVTGSEIVGLVPRGPLLAAGAHYLRRQGLSPGAPAGEVIRVAVRSLGLSDVAPFDPARKVIEDVLIDPGALVERRLSSFTEATSAGTPVPGGGSAAAVSGALSASLVAMVANLAAESRKTPAGRRARLGRVAERAQVLREWMLAAVDQDSRAYDEVVKAGRMPRKSDADKDARSEALARATAHAARVPFTVLERTVELLEMSRQLIDDGLESSLSDAGVAALEAAAAAEGAHYNVLVNLPGFADQVEADDLELRAGALLGSAHHLANEVRSIVLERLLTASSGC